MGRRATALLSCLVGACLVLSWWLGVGTPSPTTVAVTSSSSACETVAATECGPRRSVTCTYRRVCRVGMRWVWVPGSEPRPHGRGMPFVDPEGVPFMFSTKAAVPPPAVVSAPDAKAVTVAVVLGELTPAHFYQALCERFASLLWMLWRPERAELWPRAAVRVVVMDRSVPHNALWLARLVSDDVVLASRTEHAGAACYSTVVVGGGCRTALWQPNTARPLLGLPPHNYADFVPGIDASLFSADSAEAEYTTALRTAGQPLTLARRLLGEAARSDRRPCVVPRTGKRRLLNEGQLIERLQARVVPVRDAPPEQQARFVAAHCSALVGVHGAGLSHMVWLQEGSRVVELFGHAHKNVVFELLARSLGLPYSRVRHASAEEECKQRFSVACKDRDFQLTATELERVVERVVL